MPSMSRVVGVDEGAIVEVGADAVRAFDHVADDLDELRCTMGQHCFEA